ncbi:hypothetical protein CC86DRAFT_108347 [Ophiobolus disseminans]|uniref:Calpain catalytic domain-containing protein n=1 Tax=Ophiobolus disseminans TaxID=1469910 RepID=A0A6A6ZJL5_9PLEO|nr:hypothetical protein CC86DRAFT_108347 [Ophiobolus disseminans]
MGSTYNDSSETVQSCILLIAHRTVMSNQSTAYSKIKEGTNHHGDEDKIGLLNNRPVQPKRKKWSTCVRALIVTGIIILLVLVYLGGLVTEWRLRPLTGRFGNKVIGSQPASSQQSTSNFSGGPALGNIGNLTIPVNDQGTNFNAPTLKNVTGQGGNGSSFFLLGAPPDLKTLTDPTKNPTTPLPNRVDCPFAYRPHLGFDGSMPLGDLIRGDGRIEREDARQGPIGDCGFIAAIIALISTGRQLDLTRAITRVGNSLEVRFKFPVEALFFANKSPLFSTRTDVVKIDDKLPSSTLSSEEQSNKGCGGYLAAYPGLGPSIIPARPVLYVPLLEKAWSKYTDAHPEELRSSLAKENNALGYPGIEGTSPALVMQALTGLQAQSFTRLEPGFDSAFGVRVLLCLLFARPCVLGTPNADTLAGLGVKKEPGPAIVNQGGIIGTNKDRAFYTIIEAETARVLTLVGQHAYALDYENSDIPDGKNKTLENAEVTIINPWQQNANFRDVISEGGSIRMKLKTLIFIMDTVYFVQESQ